MARKGGLKTDAIDEKIIKLLAKDAEAPTASLVPELGLSIPAINKRIAKLKSEGVIKKTIILTDRKKLDKNVMVFVMVSLDKFETSSALFKILDEDPDILECYAITGEFDYMLKICASDIDALEDKLLKLKEDYITKTLTLFALREYKSEPTVLP